MNRLRASLAVRLSLWFFAFSVVVGVGISGLLYYTLKQTFARENEYFLDEKAHVLRLLIERPQAGAADLIRQEVEWRRPMHQRIHVLARVLDEKGAVIAQTTGMQALPSAMFPRVAGMTRVHGPIYGADGTEYDALTVVERVPGAAGAVRTIEIAIDRGPTLALLKAFRDRLIRALAVALALSGLLGGVIVRRALAPLRTVIGATRRARGGVSNPRIETAGLPFEIAELAGAFNGMLDRMEDSFERLGRFASDLAHELRTPINILRGETEVALARSRTIDEYRECMSSALEEYERLSRMIESLLFLAKAEDPSRQIERTSFPVREELAAVCDFFEAVAQEKGVRLEVEAPGELVLRADRTLFRRAVVNLVSNSLNHTKSGGRVVASARASASAAGLASPGVVVEVADSGEGIAHEHLSHVFDRFYRVDRARGAAQGGQHDLSGYRIGLGLSIVKSIMQLHGGEVKIGSEPGRGTRVELEFSARA